MSDFSRVTTLQAPPEGVEPPVATVEPNRLDTIHLSWQEPLKPNGGCLANINILVVESSIYFNEIPHTLIIVKLEVFCPVKRESTDFTPQ